jgi:ribosomal protein L29
MKAKELSKKSKKDLQKMLTEDREKLRGLKFNLASGKVKNVREIHAVKKDIARILTVLNKQENA